ncbi:MAG: BlaI/MecI/CopY family transcriptional regulator [Peptococcaceae bacterium]|jgi:predicted transcriptional regulator|nr:BlaI/MecI/CopY family transcriptional regulator [Peptococcaceae bacterium]
MDHYKLYDGEFKFISVIWDTEPVNSTELVRLCADKLGWKKSTTYTMLKRMSGRGLLQNTDTIVTTLVNREQVRQYETETLLNKHFDGSIPSFVASFLRDRKLTEAEAREIRALIDEGGGRNG